MSNQSVIKCPSCHSEFAIEKVIAQNLENDIREKYYKKLKEETDKINAIKYELEKKELTIKNQEQFLNEQVEKKLNQEKIKITDVANKKAQEKMQMEFDLVNKELNEKSLALSEAKKLELEYIQKERKLKEAEAQMQLELEKKLQLREQQLIEQVQLKTEEAYNNKIKQLEKTVVDLTQLAKDANRVGEQGSMQLQGEVQELELEHLLATQFIYDTVTEVKKGARGADCTLHVKNNLGEICGQILFESKNAQHFENAWIEKLKVDMREKKIPMAVIVTKNYPKDMKHFELKDGIYICKMYEVKPLVMAIRHQLISIHDVIKKQENKGDKMQLLYDYLTNHEFKQHIEAIVEGFTSVKSGIVKERISMEKIWAERDKQIEKVLMHTVNFYGSIQGIAGSAVSDIKFLQ